MEFCRNAIRLPSPRHFVIVGAVYFLVVCMWLTPPVIAQEKHTIVFADEPAAHEFYNQMRAALQGAKSLSFVSHYKRESPGKFRSACTYRVSLKKPNFFRMETSTVSGEQGGVLIGDGEALWIHWPQGRPRWEYVKESEADEKTRFNSYMTKPAKQRKHSILHEAVFLGAGMSLPILDLSTFHGHVDSIEKYLDGVRSLGMESVGGEDCNKIELSWMDHQRSWYLWLSKRDQLPRKLKEIVRVSYEVVTTEEWSSVTINKALPEAMFVWKPPTGWREWKRPSEDDGLLKSGSKAPDFDLASIVDGKRIKLSDYRGKTVWLCFWRVGCPPCREEFPFLQELYTKHKDKDFIVLGINVWDDEKITRDFLNQVGVAFPNILDTSEAADKLCSESYGGGTVPLNCLIDRDGLVVDTWYEDSRPRAKQALEKVGIDLEEPVR